jgi:hypothetical protein
MEKAPLGSPMSVFRVLVCVCVCVCARACARVYTHITALTAAAEDATGVCVCVCVCARACVCVYTHILQHSLQQLKTPQVIVSHLSPLNCPQERCRKAGAN